MQVKYYILWHTGTNLTTRRSNLENVCKIIQSYDTYVSRSAINMPAV
jgi:hypothetical protein